MARIPAPSRRPISVTSARALSSAFAALVLTAGLSGCSSDNGGATSAALQPEVVKPGTLTVCTSFGFAPFEFMRDGQPAGFDIDLAKAVAQQLKMKPVFVNGDFRDIQSGLLLNEGKCDVAVAGMTINGERARVLDFSSPYFDAAQAMVAKQGSEFVTLDDLKGGKIGVQDGTTTELYVRDNAPDSTKVVPFTTPGDVTAAIKKGRVDAGVYDSTVVGDIVAKNPRLAVVATFATGEQYGMAVKKNASVDLLRFINNVLAELKRNGGYDKIYNRWIGDVSAP
jgi:polar amino acid transport system substrate-binding protein